MTLPQKKPVLSLCVPTKNRADLLMYCLENLRALDQYDIDYEVVVLDHGSTDHTQEMLKEAQKKWPGLRVYVQKDPVNLMAQFIAALRLARGEFCMLLPDDDKIIPDKLVAYVKDLQANPNIAASYAPMVAWDDAEEKVVNHYFTIPERRVFTKGQEFELLTYMTDRLIYPEGTIYRCSALFHLAFWPDNGPLFNFLWLFEFLRHGDIVFQTEPFMLEVAQVKPQFQKGMRRVNVSMSATLLDTIRSGLEIASLRVIQAIGGEKVSDEARILIHEMLLRYTLDRLGVAFNRAMAAGDYVPASQLAQRIILWMGNKFSAKAEEEANRALFGAAVQEAGHLFQSLSWKDTLVVYGFKTDAPIETILRLRFPDIKLEITQDEAVVRQMDPEKTFLAVRLTEHKALFADQFGPGEMMSVQESLEYFKFYNIDYTL